MTVTSDHTVATTDAAGGRNPSQPVTDPIADSAELDDWFGRRVNWWLLSVFVSLSFVMLTGLLWATWPEPDKPPEEPVSIELYLAQAQEINPGIATAPKVETGIFVQTLEFESATDVNVTGYAWQRFRGDHESTFKRAVAANARLPLVNLDDPDTPCDEGIPDDYGDRLKILEDCVRPGLVFPDMVDSSFGLRPFVVGYEPTTQQRAAAKPAGQPATPPAALDTAAPGTTTIVWYFEGPIRQEFDYDHYPFDDKIVQFRIWPEDFESDAVLVPDYRGYPCPDSNGTGDAAGSGPGLICTKARDTFGVDERIVLSEFKRPEDTYFNVDNIRYTSDFGLDRFNQTTYPDLSFNMVLKRNLLNSMVSNLVPFAVGVGLAFAVLMTITGNRTRGKLFSFSTTQVITTLSALFVAVLLAHLQLRGRFEGVVYFETFYFVLYVVLLGVALDAPLVTARETRNMKLFRYGDNLIPQLLYWPTLTATITLVTLFVWL